MSVILGLDISLNATGWCRVDTATGARTFDTLNEYADLRGLQKIHAVAKSLIELCRQADLVAMEGLSNGMPMGKSGRPIVPQGRQDLVGLTYVIRLWLWKAQKKAILVAPTSLKKFTTGNHQAKKEMMILEVYKRWGVQAKDDNQADAAALAEMGRSYLNPGGILLAKFQAEAMKKVTLL